MVELYNRREVCQAHFFGGGGGGNGGLTLGSYGGQGVGALEPMYVTLKLS